MPSGKTHDAITFLLAAPVAAVVYSTTRDIGITAAVAASFLFGGLMFGPDLDTVSKQYSRWRFLRPLWFPYRTAFKHRSRWSHGLVFGTLFRVIYFLGVVTLAAYLAFLTNALIVGGDVPHLSVFTNAWQQFGGYIRGGFGEYFLAAVFVGMWAGAASHTFTDMAGTYIKTGRVTDFL
jgi:uncharacterized metal-binding protein